MTTCRSTELGNRQWGIGNRHSAIGERALSCGSGMAPGRALCGTKGLTGVCAFPGVSEARPGHPASRRSREMMRIVLSHPKRKGCV